ncbi:lysophospholipid acyltransferase family protein [Aeromicrobium chenweiae]|uniref:1-acyl-sn-glycerol-3-phosphate acyltransferase n=1 Tax=Aeromicrobium chenweiae TaxID=2079793 RepID=A0A2S0WIG9_9ACTN|nr:lysophospholipid acyltransferase family protein [Aeromicrobium chenweiae]AWB91141.1 1-acyl-sn-glycerol-3-phosphate acyltransferase [Aeromicrobium chenweiae]TGN31660.1 1-acyl-sn-glycerol-3-phosphate acyltransferase [Aeromicrobium chenweiae]
MPRSDAPPVDAPVLGSDRTYRWANRVFGTLFRLMGYRFDVRGAEHIPATGPAVLAGNHIGFLDFTFIGYAARDRGRLVRFMAKTSVFELPVVGRLMRAMRHIPVDRRHGARAYRRSLRLLDAGDLVGVFPEATISRSWLLKPFKRGAAAMAVNRRVPVVPVVVWGGHRVLTVDGRRSLRRGMPITVIVGEPLCPRPDESVDALTTRLRTRMEGLLAEAIETYPEAPRDEDDSWWLPYDHGGSAPDIETAAVLDREAVARSGDTIDEEPRTVE